MLSRKLKSKYSFIPSFTEGTGSKYKFLTETYQDIIKQFIHAKQIESEEIFKSEDDSALFYIGIEEIQNYIFNGFFYMIRDKSKKDNLTIIISSIYYRFTKVYGSEDNARNEIESDIRDIAERSIFYALGIDTYKNRSFRWIFEESEKTFIKHSFDNVFKTLVFDYMKTKSELLTQSNIVEDLDIFEDCVELKAEEIIEKSGLKNLIPGHIQEEIIDYLNGVNLKLDRMDEINKYLVKIYERLSN